jgi:ferric-dicitrate binding protein FerR (iron transport regulator)
MKPSNAKPLPPRLLMAYLDGELPPERAKAFERLLARHPEWQQEVDEMAAIVAATGRLKPRQPDPHVWDNYWEEIDARLARHTGWLVALAGAAILLAWGTWKIVAFAENDYVRAGIGLVLLGVAILFGAVVRGRLMEMPRDRYKGVRK